MFNTSYTPDYVYEFTYTNVRYIFVSEEYLERCRNMAFSVQWQYDTREEYKEAGNSLVSMLNSEVYTSRSTEFYENLRKT